MTTRPRRRRTAPASGEEFASVRIPEEVLDRARRIPGIQAWGVVEDYLREIHGPEPDNREEPERFRAFLDATEGVAMDLLATGALDEERSPALA